MVSQHEALRTLAAVDGSLLPALPRMMWALWLNEHHHAAHAPYIARLKECAAFTTLRQVPIPANASAVGAVLDVLVERRGSSHHKRKIHEPVRLVEVQAGTSPIVLLRDQLQMPADLIALAYRYRWNIELFLHWFKCTLGCRHLLGASLNALGIEIYAGLIASLLRSIWANEKPTRRSIEMVCHYMAGWATEEQLQYHLNENNRQPSGHSKQCEGQYWAMPGAGHTARSQAQPSTVIAKLFKIAVQLRQYKNKIVLHLPSACPFKHLLQTLTGRLYMPASARLLNSS